jgi:hypothetical protein
MTDCCAPGSGFPNASTMEQLATNYPVVWEEICMIQQAILAASSQCSASGGQMCTVVGGNTPMTFVSGVTSVTVVNGGLNYYQDFPAAIIIPPLNSAGSGATATVQTNGGSIIGITITSGGANYEPVPATLSVNSVGGTNAFLTPFVNSTGNIVNVGITNPGSGYTINDSIIAIRAVAPNVAYVDAVLDVTSVDITGAITGVAILNPGSGYQPSRAEIGIVSTLNPSLPYPTGAGFIGDVITNGLGSITQVSISNTGAGYAVYSPYLVITNPGTGATTEVTLSGASVGSIAVTSTGTGYTNTATGSVFNPNTAPIPNPPSTPAIVTINVSQNTFGTNPLLYWQVWAGTVTNKPIQLQENAVISYFKGLGYTISIQSNPATGSTIQWKICW